MDNLETQTPALDPLKDIKAKLTTEEKEKFFKAFLADQPYIEDEAIFEGKVPVKFKTLSNEENDTILQQMQFDRETGIAQNTDKYLIRVILYRIVASLLSLNKEQFATNITLESNPTNVEAKTTYLLDRLELTAKWPTFKISSLTEAFNRFEVKVRALTEESFKPNF